MRTGFRGYKSKDAVRKSVTLVSSIRAQTVKPVKDGLVAWSALEILALRVKEFADYPSATNWNKLTHAMLAYQQAGFCQTCSGILPDETGEEATFALRCVCTPDKRTTVPVK